MKIAECPVDSEEIRVGDVVFGRERVEVRSEDVRVTSVHRSTIERLEVVDAMESLHPVRELLWGVGMLVAGVHLAFDDRASGGATPLVTGFVVAVLGIWVLSRLQRRVTRVRIEGNGTVSLLSLGARLDPATVTELNVRLSRDLGYPVAKPDAPDR